MAREIFKNLPDTSTPLNANILNGIFNGEEAMGSIVVDDIRSKNIFDKNVGIVDGYYISNTGTTEELTNNFYQEIYIEVKPNTNYVLKNDKNSGALRVALYTNNYSFISRQSEEGTQLAFTTPDNCHYVRISGNYGINTLETVLSGLELCRNLTGECVYSTNEVQIGTWLGKPLYRKVISCGAIPSNSSTSTNTGLSNVTYVKVEGVAIFNNFSLPLPFISNIDLSSSIRLAIYGDKITIATTSTEYSAYTTSYVTIEYTKN